MPKSWTDDAPAPVALQEHAHLKDPFMYKIKRFFLGNPLNRHTLGHQRLEKRYALGILSSDCISSSAYGSEQILIALLPAFGLAAFGLMMPMTAVIIIILTIVTLSYRNVIEVYTKTGGAYIVTRDNFGPKMSVVAAVALMLDYIVTVAIQSAAGIAAIISTFPSLHSGKVYMTVGIIVLITYGNLRGVKEAGKSFALPTYFFVGSMAVVFVVGLFKVFSGNLPVLSTDLPGTYPVGEAQGLLTFSAIFILLRAFANGGSSLTGLEAISDGVALFKVPEARNARRTLVIMSSILGTLVLGVSWFAQRIHAMPYEGGTPTIISQIAKVALGDGTAGKIFFIFVQAATMLILFAGANTTYSAFPILCNFVAADGYLPHQLTKRGHRLAFSNGIIFLASAAIALVIITGAGVDRLVAFYALGVFTGFALAGFGMAKHAHRNRIGHWKLKMFINGLSGGVSVIVVVVFTIVKFTEGAWIVVTIAPIAVFSLIRLSSQYQREQAALNLKSQESRATSISRHDVTILVDSVDVATVGAVRYARSLNPHSLSAVHFVIDDQRAEDIRKAWHVTPALNDVMLELIDCPDRRLPNAAMDYAIRSTASPDVELTLLLPRRSYAPWLGKLLHDQTAEEIARPISQLPRVVATIIPFDVAKIISDKEIVLHELHISASQAEPASAKKGTSTVPKLKPASAISFKNNEPVSHYSETILPIGKITWRSRAHVKGRVTSIRTAPRDSAPSVEVEIWDETGGVTLQFLGRREIAGLDVGSQLLAEGMVGETEGSLTILNPSYEIVI
ncbi:MAG: amino acid permease [Candidatus Nanopelagicaceae bacterium]|nr:amino acid permease [Candidatus Nanopelagicaceae bacterium]